MEWQTIDTCLGEEEVQYLGWQGGWYCVFHTSWKDGDGNPVWFNDDVVVHPSHWQPLPEAPE